MRRIVFALVAALCVCAGSARAATRTWTGATSGLWSVAANWGGAAPVAGDDLVFPAGPSTLATANDFAAGTTFHSIAITGADYILGGNAITLGGGDVLVSAPATISLAIAGSGAVVKNGSGDFTLSGANSFAGMVTVNGGRLIVANGSALGVADDTAANGTVINSGASIVINVAVGAERLTLFGNGASSNGALQSGGGSHSGTLILGDTNVGIAVTGTFTQGGVVNGPGRLGLGGSGTFVLGATGNTPGSVVWGVAGSPDTTLTAGADNVLPSNFILSMPEFLSHFDLNTRSITLRGISGEGRIDVAGPFAGLITLTDPPTLSYNGTMPSPNIALLGGTWVVWRATPNNFTNSGGTYYGSANTYVQSSGNMHRGAATATINGGTLFLDTQTSQAGIGGGIPPYGTFFSTLNLTPGATVRVIIDGTASTEYGRADMFGTMNINGATLAVNLNNGPYPVGTKWRIVTHEGLEANVGTFAGLPEGAVFTVGLHQLKIRYADEASHNTVTLEVVGSPLPPIAATTTTLTSSNNPSIHSEPVTFTATVTSGAPTATGNVTFFDGTSTLSIVPLNGSGVATLTITSLPAGAHSVTAVYGGDATHSGSSSNAVVQQVNPEPQQAPALDAGMLAALSALLAISGCVALRR